MVVELWFIGVLVCGWLTSWKVEGRGGGKACTCLLLRWYHELGMGLGKGFGQWVWAMGCTGSFIGVLLGMIRRLSSMIDPSGIR